MSTGLHHIKVTVPDARAVLTSIEVDGQELRGVTLVDFHIDMAGNAVLRLEMFADIEITGEAEIVKE